MIRRLALVSCCPDPLDIGLRGPILLIACLELSSLRRSELYHLSQFHNIERLAGSQVCDSGKLEICQSYLRHLG